MLYVSSYVLLALNIYIILIVYLSNLKDRSYYNIVVQNSNVIKFLFQKIFCIPNLYQIFIYHNIIEINKFASLLNKLQRTNRFLINKNSKH